MDYEQKADHQVDDDDDDDDDDDGDVCTIKQMLLILLCLVDLTVTVDFGCVYLCELNSPIRIHSIRYESCRTPTFLIERPIGMSRFIAIHDSREFTIATNTIAKNLITSYFCFCFKHI